MTERANSVRACAPRHGLRGKPAAATISVRGATCRLLCCLAALAASWLAAPAAVQAAKPGATTSRAARAEALRAIPMNQIEEDARRKVAYVLSDISIYRRMPTQIIRCDPNLYVFMVEHPNIAVNMWEVLQVSQLTLEPTAPRRFRLDDHQGTLGDVEVLYSSPEMHLIYARGRHDGKLFSKPIRGSGVMLLRSGYVREANGDTYITCQLDVFVRVDHLGAELIAKTLQPLVGRVADYNFLESSAFVSSLSRTAEVRPKAAQALTERLARVSDDDKAELSRLLSDITDEADARHARRVAGIEAAAEAEALQTTTVPKPLGLPFLQR